MDRVWPAHGRRCPRGADTDGAGRFGERVAASWLRGQGYRVLARRFRCAQGEVDLVCRLGGDLVFVEVKARSDVSERRPVQTIRPRQRRRIRRAAHAWMRMLDKPGVVLRYDVVEVELNPGCVPVCTVIRNAFDPEPEPGN